MIKQSGEVADDNDYDEYAKDDYEETDDEDDAYGGKVLAASANYYSEIESIYKKCYYTILDIISIIISRLAVAFQACLKKSYLVQTRLSSSPADLII